MVSKTKVSEQIEMEDRQAERVRTMRMKQLVRDMYGCLLWQGKDHGYMLDGCDHCINKAKAGCGLERFAERARGLGIRVQSR